MNAYCPECETELDQATGICPACRWDPLLSAARRSQAPVEPPMSLTERYRGTPYDIQAKAMPKRSDHLSRGRLFVVVAMVAAAGLYGLALGVLGMI